MKLNYFLPGDDEMVRTNARAVEDLLSLLGRVTTHGVGHGMAQLTLETHYTAEDVYGALRTLCVTGELFHGVKKINKQETCHANPDLVAAE